MYFANVSIITEQKKKFTEKYYETIGNFLDLHKQVTEALEGQMRIFKKETKAIIRNDLFQGCMAQPMATHIVGTIRLLFVWLTYFCSKIAKSNMKHQVENCSDLHKTFAANFTLFNF